MENNLTIFDFVNLNTPVFHEKNDFKTVKSILFPSSQIGALTIDLEENFNLEKAVIFIFYMILYY